MDRDFLTCPIPGPTTRHPSVPTTPVKTTRLVPTRFPMARPSPLKVDQLEDRCVPATDVLATGVAPLIADPAAIVLTAPSSPAPETFVIDPYLIDPLAPVAPKPPDTN